MLASVRAELQEDAAAMTRRKLRDFEGYVATRVAEVIAEVDEGVGAHLADVANENAKANHDAMCARAAKGADVAC